jgi:ketosteroid isomerase-like protein
VEVLDSGTLGHTEGPVTNAKGEVNVRFSSVWRRESAGSWKIVFDQGYEVCHCDKPVK